MRNNPAVFPDGARGSIVLISSMSGYFGGTGVVSYVSSKHAITGLLRSSQDTANKTAIRINAIAPFFTPTQITAGFSQKWQEKNLLANTTSDVAHTVLYTALNPALMGRCIMVRFILSFLSTDHDMRDSSLRR
jgi:NAD(P)-dependent dehydrogenase (short-subunit alcohol dehydrogenase family)